MIVASVLVALKAFAFHGLISTQHPDVLPFWLPTWCHLGRSIAAGHVPAWNPAVMGGIPFASDPQSGWLYLPPMALFSALSCAPAMDVFIVLQPILAGLGLYWFLRSEGLSRPAATVGGLGLSLPVAGSVFVLSLPFAGMFAWTPVLLACASRYLRAASWEGRVTWLILAALSWGQLASAHLSHGLVLGTAALVGFVAARLVSQVRGGHRSAGMVGALVGLLVLALPLANLAILLPRLAYLPHTTLGQGYVRLDALATRLGDYAPDKVLTLGLAPTFPLKLVRSPGFYLGVMTLGLSFAGFWNRSKRYLAVAFGLFAALCYVFSLDEVVRGLGPSVGSSAVGSFYTHFPTRVVLGMFLALPVLAALGVDAWRERRTARDRLLMVLPAVVVWGLMAAVFHAFNGAFLLPAVAAGAGTVVLLVCARSPGLVFLIPLTLACELAANSLGAVRLEFPTAEFLRPGPIAAYLMQHEGHDTPTGRYLSVAPLRWGKPGYHVLQRRPDWGLMATQRSMLYGLEEAQGYNPAQLLRYWTFVRAVDPKPTRYNAAGFIRADPVTLDLLQVGYLIQPATDPPAVPGQTSVAMEGRWVLYRLPAPPPRASVLTRWSAVASPSRALAAILAPGFDPGRGAVVEGSVPGGPGASSAEGGTASFRWESDQSARIEVDAPARAVVLIRNAYAPGWRATVDGRPAPVLPADYVIQGVPVPPGHHVVELRYRDPLLGYGLAGSAAALVLLVGTATLLAVRHRRGRSARGIEPADLSRPGGGDDDDDDEGSHPPPQPTPGRRR